VKKSTVRVAIRGSPGQPCWCSSFVLLVPVEAIWVLGNPVEGQQLVHVGLDGLVD
jgi:hypothetical protein